MIRTSNLTFSYGTTEVLRGMSVCVRDGEVTAVVGPSGSGKSTLLGILCGDLVDFKGDVTFDGSPFRGRRRPRGVAQIYQDYRLVPFLDAISNVALAVELSDRLAPGQVAERSALALLAVGLEHKAESLPMNLSGGEQQRVAIARAIATRPRYLLADEPTGSLDADNSVQIARLLRDIARSRQVGVLVATHDPLVAEVADQVVRIRDGRVVEAGP